jgi:hypothetical protein
VRLTKKTSRGPENSWLREVLGDGRVALDRRPPARPHHEPHRCGTCQHRRDGGVGAVPSGPTAAATSSSSSDEVAAVFLVGTSRFPTLRVRRPRSAGTTALRVSPPRGGRGAPLRVVLLGTSRFPTIRVRRPRKMRGRRPCAFPLQGRARGALVCSPVARSSARGRLRFEGEPLGSPRLGFFGAGRSRLGRSPSG